MKARLFVPLSLLAAALTSASLAQAPAAGKHTLPEASASMLHLGVGTIKRVDAARRSVAIDHQAIPSLNMPAMTMQFRLGEAVVPASLNVGQPVAFTFTQAREGLLIASVQPIDKAASGGSASSHAMPGHDMNRMQGMGSMGMAGCHDMMMGK
jgi:Cu/Ag efflux protein CusF